MRSRLPAILLLLSAFLLGPAPAGVHPPATAPPAAGAASITVAPPAGTASITTAPPAGTASTTVASVTAADIAEAATAGWDSPAVRAGQDAAPPRLHPTRQMPAPPLWLAMPPSSGQRDPDGRRITTITGHPGAAPQPAGRRAPARAPPSMTR
ncbi:hypothetical protein ABZT47_18910 [Sphaerisporangium sp. NPDC005289]|uniref:hypothetical protein n=1 Tax=Sphaerisporangium sp. NPDC005289 TaxID=3155247 RepID=UPI0033BA1AA5